MLLPKDLLIRFEQQSLGNQVVDLINRRLVMFFVQDELAPHTAGRRRLCPLQTPAFVFCTRRRTVALDIFNRQYIDGYMFDVEILHLASLAKYHISQVPVHWRDDADSRLKLVHDNIRNIVDIFRIRFSKKS